MLLQQTLLLWTTIRRAPGGNLDGEKGTPFGADHPSLDHRMEAHSVVTTMVEKVRYAEGPWVVTLSAYYEGEKGTPFDGPFRCSSLYGVLPQPARNLAFEDLESHKRF